ncbi:MAG: hypothetical protein WCV81_05970 [Microgenomates group bacterium]|jgi:hypothetical protein
MSIEGVSISGDGFSSAGVGISAPSSPGIGMGSEFSSFSSFSSFETSGLSGGSLNPSIDIFNSPSIDITPIPSIFNESFADINLDPDVPTYEVPQAFRDAFTEDSVEEILIPSSYLESIIEPSFFSEPEIVEISDEILEAPLSQILDREIEEALTEENIIQEIVPELVIQNIEQMVSEDVIVEVAENLASLSEVTSILPEILSDPISIPEAIQASITYESLITAGIEEASATELVQTALIQSGTEPEAVAQIMKQTIIKSEQKVTEIEKTEVIEEEVAEEEKKQIKKPQYKFVLDAEALAKRDEALKKAVEGIPEEMIDAEIVAAGMPTEIENRAVKSGILTKNMLDFLSPFYQGDGAYRLFVAAIGKLGLKTKWEILQKGWELNRRFIPVTISESGQEAGEEDVKRVLNPKPNAVLNLRNFSGRSAV